MCKWFVAATLSNPFFGLCLLQNHTTKPFLLKLARIYKKINVSILVFFQKPFWAILRGIGGVISFESYHWTIANQISIKRWRIKLGAKAWSQGLEPRLGAKAWSKWLELRLEAWAFWLSLGAKVWTYGLREDLKLRLWTNFNHKPYSFTNLYLKY